MDGGLTTSQSLLGALVVSLLLAALHLAAPRIRRLPFVPEDVTGSFAGGLAVAYVFLHLLPELAEGNEAIGEALSDVVEPTPLLDLGIFLVALAGSPPSTDWNVWPGCTPPAARVDGSRPGSTGSTSVPSWSTTA